MGLLDNRMENRKVLGEFLDKESFKKYWTKTNYEKHKERHPKSLSKIGLKI